MDIFARAFEVVAAQLGIAVVGFFVFRGQIQDKESILKFLSTLGIDLALPFFLSASSSRTLTRAVSATGMFIPCGGWA